MGRAIAFGLLVGSFGCADDDSGSICTSIGCEDGGVSIEAPSGTDGTLTVCTDGECQDARLIGSAGGVVVPGMRAGDVVTVTFVGVDGGRLTGEAEAQEMQPNGPDCAPVCVIAQVVLAPPPV